MATKQKPKVEKNPIDKQGIRLQIMAAGGDKLGTNSSFEVGANINRGVYAMHDVFPAIFKNNKIDGDMVKMYFYIKSLVNTQINSAFPSKKEIAKYFCNVKENGDTKPMSERTVDRILTKMVQANMIYIVNRYWLDSNSQSSNLYFVNMYDVVTGDFVEETLQDIKDKFPTGKAFTFKTEKDMFVIDYDLGLEIKKKNNL